MVAREKHPIDFYINASFGLGKDDAIGKERTRQDCRGQKEELRGAFHGVPKC
jgi:hypothetical protein